MNNNWQPRIGQKVVALEDLRRVRKGDVFKVQSLLTCPSCGICHILLEEVDGAPGLYSCNCGNKLTNSSDRCGAPSKYFAPLPEQYADCTSAIAAQPQTIERYDGAPVSVPREAVPQSN